MHDGEIIGEGWHKKAGGAHAEVNAIMNVKDKSQLQYALRQSGTMQSLWEDTSLLSILSSTISLKLLLAV